MSSGSTYHTIREFERAFGAEVAALPSGGYCATAPHHWAAPRYFKDLVEMADALPHNRGQRGKARNNYKTARSRAGAYDAADLRDRTEGPEEVAWLNAWRGVLKRKLGLCQVYIIDRRGPYEAIYLVRALDTDGGEVRALVDTLRDINPTEVTWNGCAYGAAWPPELRPLP